jgi:hypothetical protein
MSCKNKKSFIPTRSERYFDRRYNAWQPPITQRQGGGQKRVVGLPLQAEKIEIK